MLLYRNVVFFHSFWIISKLSFEFCKAICLKLLSFDAFIEKYYKIKRSLSVSRLNIQWIIPIIPEMKRGILPLFAEWKKTFFLRHDVIIYIFLVCRWWHIFRNSHSTILFYIFRFYVRNPSLSLPSPLRPMVQPKLKPRTSKCILTI